MTKGMVIKLNWNFTPWKIFYMIWHVMKWWHSRGKICEKLPVAFFHSHRAYAQRKCMTDRVREGENDPEPKIISVCQKNMCSVVFISEVFLTCCIAMRCTITLLFVSFYNSIPKKDGAPTVSKVLLTAQNWTWMRQIWRKKDKNRWLSLLVP